MFCARVSELGLHELGLYELGGGFSDGDALKGSNVAGAVPRTYAREEGVHAGFLLAAGRQKTWKDNGI